MYVQFSLLSTDISCRLGNLNYVDLERVIILVIMHLGVQYIDIMHTNISYEGQKGPVW